MKGTPLAAGLVVLAIVFLIIAVLYAFGVLQIAVSDSHASHHYTHAVLFVALAVASLVAANFARPKKGIYATDRPMKPRG
jgi:membrane protein YdbS with pleckstrin-like domain